MTRPEIMSGSRQPSYIGSRLTWNTTINSSGAKKELDERQPWILLQLLQNLLNKWVSPAVYDRDTLTDQILLEQFQNDLEEQTQCWVCQHLPHACKEALKLAKAFTVLEAGYSQEKWVLSPVTAYPTEVDRR